MKKLIVLTFVLLSFLVADSVLASTLSLSPATGVYTTGSTFTVRVTVNTKGAPINAADGTLSFNPKELQVVSVSRGSSIFNLWTTEPTFSNSAGTISFSGGSPTGYTGSGGTIMSVTFRTLGAGSPRVSMTNGSVLAADGRGTNVLTTMGSGAYTVSAVADTPIPEAIVEFVPPANTPAAPKIISETHGDGTGWSKERTARLSWTVPGDVTAVRTLLDENPTSIPTKVYDSPIRDITIDDLPDGISYFHIQFKNDEGWGRVAHYRLAVDSSAPQGFVVMLAPDSNLANPTQTLIATTTDTLGAPIKTFKIRVNNGEEIIQENTAAGQIKLENLSPGQQVVDVEAVDAAGNTVETSFTFEIEAFEAPRFTDVPAIVNSGVIPVITGTTRPKSSIKVVLSLAGASPIEYIVTAQDDGTFRFVPDAKLVDGVYKVSAQATDEFGAMSELSSEISFVVQPSGFVRIGGILISFLSIIVPLIALLFLTAFTWFFFLARYRTWRRKVARESGEVMSALHEQFRQLSTVIDEHEEKLQSSRKTKKLTAAEEALITDLRTVLRGAESVVEKEVKDVTDLTD